MAPKTLQLRPTPPSIDQPRPGHGFGQATFAPDFTTFGFWSALQLMLELLFSGRQPEQLWRPGSPFPGNVPAEMATLFPGTGPVNQSWTPPELYMVARSRLFWMFQIHPGSTLPGSPEAWAPFMMYLTLPLATLQAAVAAAQGTGYFRVQHAGIPGTLDRCLNVSFSPRSAYLFCTFQLSIMRMQRVEYTNFGLGHTLLITALGCADPMLHFDVPWKHTPLLAQRWQLCRCTSMGRRYEHHELFVERHFGCCMRPTFLRPWQATFDVVDMRRCCNFPQPAAQNFLREPYTCIDMYTLRE